MNRIEPFSRKRLLEEPELTTCEISQQTAVTNTLPPLSYVTWGIDQQPRQASYPPSHLQKKARPIEPQDLRIEEIQKIVKVFLQIRQKGLEFNCQLPNFCVRDRKIIPRHLFEQGAFRAREEIDHVKNYLQVKRYLQEYQAAMEKAGMEADEITAILGKLKPHEEVCTSSGLEQTVTHPLFI